MKKLLGIVLVLWSGLTSFISPIWLTLTFYNITGLIYKYDYSMDEGTAGIFGIVFAVLWILFALIPNVTLIKKVYKKDKKLVVVDLMGMIILWLICFVICDWNIIGFLFWDGAR